MSNYVVEKQKFIHKHKLIATVAYIDKNRHTKLKQVSKQKLITYLQIT